MSSRFIHSVSCNLLPGLVLSLVASAVHAAGWPVYGGDPGGRHYSTLADINRNNVDDLQVAWVFRSGDSARDAAAMDNTSTQSTPILLPEAAGSSLVYCTPFNRVIALDPGSGEQRWDFDPQINRGGDRPFRCRGVAYAQDAQSAAAEHCQHRIYLSTHDRHLWALDALDGRPCAGFGNSGSVALYGAAEFAPGDVSNSSPPVIANGVVISGSTVIDFTRAQTPRGTVQAFNAHSGKPIWEFDPLAGHAGSGSANVWAPLSVDAEQGLVFLPTSAPSPDYYGAGRVGDSRYANSVVALELATGKLRWHFQHVRHDLWDYDTPAQPILFDWQRDGVSVPALVQLTKQGLVFALNRLTGESLWEMTEQPVPPSHVPGETAALSQPKPIAPPPLLDSFLMPHDAWGLTPVDRADCRKQLESLHNLGLFTPISEAPTLMYPGSLGGPNWGGGALLAERGTLLINVNNIAFSGRLVPLAAEAFSGNGPPTAGKRFRVVMQGTPYAAEIGSLQSFLGLPCNPPPWGKLIAVDLYGGRIIWETALGSVHEMGPVPVPFHIEWGTPNLGGGIATAGGLFFIAATMDRQLRAFDVDSGATLWRYTLPVDATATPMTYRYQGRQYVVVNAGGHHMFGRGSGDYLYAFGLPP
jgi:quinoprotein glucose dehydrogenase